MRVVLDSHTLIWAADDPGKVSAAAMRVMQDAANDLLVSVGTIWEVAIKTSIGKLPLSLPYRQWIDKAISDQKLSILDVTLNHAERLTVLPFHHRDPFDRLLVAQALVEGIAVVSRDPILDAYGVPRIWN